MLYAALILLWLLLMMLPLTAVILAAQGEIEIGGDGRYQTRIFLLQQRDAEGVGLSWTRPRRGQPHCQQTTVTYLMWRGQGERVTYCLCFDAATGETISATSCP